jgi:hypothetical protein
VKFPGGRYATLRGIAATQDRYRYPLSSSLILIVPDAPV